MKLSGGPIILGGLALALLFGSTASAATPDKTGRDPLPDLDLGPLPETEAELEIVDAAVCECGDEIEDGVEDAVLLECVAENLWPEVPWPPVEGDHASIHTWWAFMAERVALYLEDPDAFCAATPEPEPEPDPINPQFVDPVPPDVLEPWVSATPVAGKFYQIKQGDELVNIARAALNKVIPGAGQKGGLRIEYIKCITSGPEWNWRLYASSSFSGTFPQNLYSVNGMGLRRAFFPWHPDASVEILLGRMPDRAITQGGARLAGMGNDYALLWLPPLSAQHLENDAVTCGAFAWEDGTSSIDPPPEILDLLTEHEGFQQG